VPGKLVRGQRFGIVDVVGLFDGSGVPSIPIITAINLHNSSRFSEI
jgi:hypothetical protein